jgi:hypothetical protein
LDGSPCFGEPLSPPEAAFAAAKPRGGTVGLSYQSTATQGGGAKNARLTLG